MGILSTLRAIDDNIRQPDEAQIKAGARQWWVFLVLSALSFGITPCVYFLTTSDVRFLLLLAPLLGGLQLAFLAGFQFNNHLRADGRRSEGFWGRRALR